LSILIRVVVTAGVGVIIDVAVLDRIGIDNSFLGCTGVDVTAGVGVTTDVGNLDRIGIDNSFSGCTGVDITAGVGEPVDTFFFFSVGADKDTGSTGSFALLVSFGVTTDVSVIVDVGVTAGVGASNGSRPSISACVIPIIAINLSNWEPKKSEDVYVTTGVGITAGVSVVVEKSVDAVSDTGGIFGADFFSLLVSFVFSDMKISAAAGAAADSVTGALVRFGMSSDGVFFSEASK
jgi:hypothetical protein